MTLAGDDKYIQRGRLRECGSLGIFKAVFCGIFDFQMCMMKNDPFNLQSFLLADSTELHLGVSKNRVTPKWMVYNGKPFENS